MNKTINKILSLVMIVMMIMSVVPMSAFAKDVLYVVGSHDYDWVTTTAATCTTKGVEEKKCKRGDGCTATTGETREIPALGHVEVVIPAKKPGCTTPGHTEGKYCSRCYDVLVACNEIAYEGHKSEAYAAIPATCTEPGKDAGTKCSVCGDNLTGGSVIAAKGHSWKMQSYEAPNCKTEKNGTQVNKCSACPETETKTIEYTHNYGAWKVTQEATCSAEGKREQTCKDCGHKNEEKIAKLEHVPEAYAAQAATCVNPGKEAGTKCKLCGENLSGGATIAPKGHDLVTVKGVAATCTTKGETDGIYCKNCNYVKQNMVEVAPLGHKMVDDTTKSYAATCTKAGLKVQKCENEGCTYTTQEVLPITHKGELRVVEDATCTKDGKKVGYCSVCKQTVTEVIPATGHKVSSELSWKVKTQATCTKDGVMTAECDVCGKDATKAIPATGHKEITVAGKEPTCKEPGLTDGIRCYYCAYEIKAQEVIPAGHAYDKTKAEVVKEATCKEEGTIKYKCTKCTEFVTEKTEKLPHTEVEIPAKPNTCTEDGNEAGVKCSVCDAIIKEATILKATGHNWVKGEDSKDPTCTETGYLNQTCTRCGERQTGTVDATGHKNTEEIPATAPDCINSGISAGIKCKDCGAWVQERTTLEALGHDWILDSTKSTPSTCTEKGLNFYNCSRCKQTNSEEVAVIDHAWSEWITDTEATCQTSGTKHRECASCKLVETETIPNGGGCNIVSSEYVDPTCTTPGYTGGTHCTKCNTVYEAPQEIPALGHDYQDQIIPATTESDGSYSSVCANCNSVISEVIEKIESVSLSSTAVTYNGKARTPSVKATNASGEALVNGTDYTYTYSEDEMIAPGSYTVTVEFKGKYEGTETFNFLIRPGKTTKITTAPTSKGTTKIYWKAVPGATGYRVYVSNGKSWKAVAAVSATNYILTKDYNGKALKMGSSYKICVRAYTKQEDGTVVYSGSYLAYTFKQVPAKVTVKASSSKGKINLSWNNITGETGYQVWYCSKKDGKYAKLSNISANTVKYTRSMKKGNTYYFKVRAYTKVGNSYVYGDFSTPVACKIK